MDPSVRAGRIGGAFVVVNIGIIGIILGIINNTI